MLPTQFKNFSQSLVAVSVFASNILFRWESGYFADSSEEKPLLHTWSLAVEEQYYMLFPIFLILLWRFGRSPVFYSIIVISIISLLLSEWGWRNKPEANFYLAPTRVWELLAGSICAFLQFGKTQKTNNTLSAFGLALIVFAIFFYDESTPFPSIYALAPVVGTALIIMYGARGTWVAQLLSLKGFVGIGLISYSAYLWHQPLFAFARIRSLYAPEQWLMLTLAIASLVLAYFSWRYVEHPFRKRAAPALCSQRAIFRAASVVGAIFIVFGGGGIVSNGYLERYADEDKLLAFFDKAEAEVYVENRFASLLGNPFPKNQSSNVLIIGDSYAQDFVNILYEGNLDKRVNISTHHISKECGNLFVQNNLNDFIDPNFKHYCERLEQYNDKVLEKIMEADYVILASSWKIWQARLIDESVRNIQSTTNAQIIVLGRKNFGEINRANLLQVSAADRIKLRNNVSINHTSVNRIMSNSNLPSFIDFQKVVCQDEDTCPIFTNEGNLISFDGGHLTKDGAIYISTILITAAPILGRIFE